MESGGPANDGKIMKIGLLSISLLLCSAPKATSLTSPVILIGRTQSYMLKLAE